MKLVIKKGKHLSKKLADEIFSIWKNAFDHPRERKEKYADYIFFVLKNKDKIVSVGRLEPVKVKFLGKIHNILGIALIVSVETVKLFDDTNIPHLIFAMLSLSHDIVILSEIRSVIAPFIGSEGILYVQNPVFDSIPYISFERK